MKRAEKRASDYVRRFAFLPTRVGERLVWLQRYYRLRGGRAVDPADWRALQLLPRRRL